MRWTVTLESQTQAPRTWMNTVEATAPQSAAARAIREARKTFKGARWSSLVVVLEKPLSDE